MVNTAMSRPLLLLFLTAFLCLPVVWAGEDDPKVTLKGHVPSEVLKKAKDLGLLDPQQYLFLTFSLPLRNKAHLKATLEKLYDPQNPAYGQYLSPKTFRDRYAPTVAETREVIRQLAHLGLSARKVSSNRLLMEVAAPASVIQKALGVEFHRYQFQGRVFHASPWEPKLPKYLAKRVLAISGLDDAVKRVPRITKPSMVDQVLMASVQGSGPQGGLSPSDIASAYNLQSISATGTGQMLALLQMDGFNQSDITFYQQYYNLPAIPVETILMPGATGIPGSNADEVTLDIELQMASAPGISRILAYEGPNTNAGILAIFSRIANDNRAKTVSTSWGLSEMDSTTSFMKSENQIFMQMAAQGQTLFAASGDAGAYDTTVNNKPVLSVDDPASQPYVTGVGGTRLILGAGQSYGSESVWSNGANQSGGGGGISQVWPLPDWQQTVTTKASNTMRNVPDISLNSDPATGYSIYYRGGWTVLGGTSCAAPIWSGFAARVNQQRIANGLPSLGWFNPTLYKTAQTLRYSSDFHDITQGNNLYYSAGPGYDNATGWGTFLGAGLFQDLTAQVKVPQTITPDATATLIWGQSITLSPVASSGLLVQIVSNTPAICTLNGAILTGVSPGSCLLTLSQSGSSSFLPATDVIMTINVIEPLYKAPLKRLKTASMGALGHLVSDPVGIDCGTYCENYFTQGTSVTLTATPGTGATFSRWRGACTGRNPVCKVRLGISKSVTAIFR